MKNSLDSEECQFADALKPELVINSVVICSFSHGFLNGTSSIAAILDTAKALHFIGFIFIANPAYGDFIAHPLPFSVPGIMIPRVADAQVVKCLFDYIFGVAITILLEVGAGAHGVLREQHL